MSNTHTFHIPVMGLAFTIDTPIRVAALGISSALSITDDELIEKMAAFYSTKFKLPNTPITTKTPDYRALRITNYLNLVDKIVTQKFEALKNEFTVNKAALDKYLSMLPNQSEIRNSINSIIKEGHNVTENIRQFIEHTLSPGSIDVNIMTKVDKQNTDADHNVLPPEYNDAHAALRGFANSNLASSVILSAGMNPRLYGYFENFPDFYPNPEGNLRKKIILKVSDFRSAQIQGNFLAKKGLWVSEYRIESGLNCGGHAFATEGLVLGPILAEFTAKKEELRQSSFNLMAKALEQRGYTVPADVLPLKITVQGGVGTAEEHDFLLNHYNVDSVGWGSPFLLVPEATLVDKDTRQLLADADEHDLYLSHMSPLGVPFNSVRGTSNEKLKQLRSQKGRYGSSCPKKYLAMTPDTDGALVCTASRKFQEKRLLSATTADEKDEIAEKSCLCVGLANPAYMEHGIAIKGEAQGVVVCPGPNMAYYTEEVSLERMVRHIYGTDNIITTNERPNFFIKELGLYVAHLTKETEAAEGILTKKLLAFRQNLLQGVEYYKALFSGGTHYFNKQKNSIMDKLEEYKQKVENLGNNTPDEEKEYICSKQCATCQCQQTNSFL